MNRSNFNSFKLFKVFLFFLSSKKILLLNDQKIMYANVREILIFSLTLERYIYVYIYIYVLLYIIIDCLLDTQTIVEI